MICAGVVTSTLIGVFYLSPGFALITRIKFRFKKKLLAILTATSLIALTFLAFAEITLSPPLMMVGAALVLSTMFAAGFTASRIAGLLYSNLQR